MYCGLFPGTEIDRQASAVFGMVFGEMDSFLSLLLTGFAFLREYRGAFWFFSPVKPNQPKAGWRAHLTCILFISTCKCIFLMCH